MPAIEASKLTKVYRTYRKERGLWGAVKGLAWRRYEETRAADQITFQIEEGEFVVCAGLSGSGKSTLVRVLSGLAPHAFGGTFGGDAVVAYGAKLQESPAHSDLSPRDGHVDLASSWLLVPQALC